ncbi:tRNA (adenosine(37)-N6)-dimethylallyltransferase MiaA [Phormidium sp. FACHB-592]|uniref:tRNA dimethylallyltransferase n=1 Tax=Stenomitos frigidus AS-A4 TaxID=2933935 RepID=A0ABV0KHC0_9CYAN|nr:tRNA (adenosine(37)-N6)-dimethylallyltransferase MiaA [Phormidium sp. FACHB-592]MBD2073546.1 tRNA (adenosine(37)-N6)-dimethylallyltransferase MiaA [Phormidium sp. FACHB-592]
MDQPLLTVPLPTNSSLTESNTSVPYLIVVCGATATGKSGLAIALAKRLRETKRVDPVILSADSRQVYREFNIGTAKPSIAEQQQVPHYLIDICDPTETLTVAEYQEKAQALIEGGKAGGRRQKAEGKGGESGGAEVGSQNSETNSKLKTKTSPIPYSSLPNPSLLVGGTGLYIKAIVRGLKIPQVAPHMELRSQLQALGQLQLYAFLLQVDPDAAAKIHPNDRVRTLRALEVFYVTGCPLSAQQGEKPPTYPILQIGLDCESVEQSDHRIAQRTEEMVAAGFADEVQYLCQKYGAELPLLDTLGYAEFKQHLAGDLSLEEAKALTVLHTRQFAKRQRTWFRADPAIEWFDADSPALVEQVWQRVQEFLANRQ